VILEEPSIVQRPAQRLELPSDPLADEDTDAGEPTI